MDEKQVKVECLKLCHTGSPQATLENAKVLYNWVMGKPSVAPKTKTKKQVSKQPDNKLV